MKKYLWSWLILSALIPLHTVSAEEVRRDVTIVKVTPMAHARPVQTASQGITRIYVNDASWGSTTCRTDAADLKNEDSHILSMFMAAWFAGKSIRINVDSNLRPIDTTCQITYITVE